MQHLMRVFCLFFWLIFCSNLSAQTESAVYLADKHQSKGVACQTCHDVAVPEKNAWVESQTCLQCHQRTQIEEATADDGEYNPHKNHLGEIDCTICHAGHSESVSYCINCHNDIDGKMN